MSRMSRVMAIANTPSLNASRRSVPRSVPPVSNWLMHCSTFLSSGTADAQSHVQTHGGTVAASAFRGGALADTDPRNYVHDPLRSLLNIAVGQFTKLITGDSDVRCRNQGRVKPALPAAAPAVRPPAYSSARRKPTAAREGPALSSAPTAASRTDRRRQR